jgi:hypothetical protein
LPEEREELSLPFSQAAKAINNVVAGTIQNDGFIAFVYLRGIIAGWVAMQIFIGFLEA